MPLNRILLFALVILTVVNGLIFVFRDLFTYKPYSSYLSLYKPCNAVCERKWHRFANDYSKIELQQAKRITDSITLGDTSTIDKVTSIAKFLHDRFYRQIGEPSFELSISTPLTQYRKLSASKDEQLWCGNFAVITAFFCWSQGIITRNVEITHPGNHHVLDECYIAETRSWMMTDPTDNILSVKDKSGNNLNFVALRDSLKRRSQLLATRSTGDSVTMEDLKIEDPNIPVQYTGEDRCHFYYQIDGREIYKPSNKLNRYLLPNTWYEIYDENEKHNNISFYLKEVFLALWIITGFAFLISRSKFKL